MQNIKGKFCDRNRSVGMDLKVKKGMSCFIFVFINLYTQSFLAQGLRFTADHNLNFQGLWKTSISVKVVVFLVKANAYAYMTLSESPGVTLMNSYDIQFGMEDNSKIVIYKHGANSQQKEARMAYFLTFARFVISASPRYGDYVKRIR